MKKRLLAFFLIALVVFPLGTASAALSDAQKQVLQSGVYYFNTDDSQNCSATGASSTGSGGASGNLFIIGDSYSLGLQQHGLLDDLKAKGYSSVDIDGSTGRSLTGAGQDGNKLSGIDALDADQAKIKAAGTVLVVLGTNGIGVDDAQAFMKKLNSINGSAAKFWMNTGNLDQTDADIQTHNKIIDRYSQSLSYTVIDWYSTFKQNPSKYFLTTGGQASLHPIDAGYAAMKDLIISSMSGAATSTNASAAVGAPAYGSASQKAELPTSAAEVTQTSSTSTKDHDGNAKITYQYLVGKGLSPAQAVGIMGNIEWETGGPSDHVGFVADDISHWPDSAYGLVQWINGRKNKLVTTMQAVGLGSLWSKDYVNGKTPSDKAGLLLGLQLDYIWWELNHGYSDVLKELKTTSTPEDSTKLIFVKYEGPRDDTEPARLAHAKQLLAQFAGVGGLTASDTSGCDPSLLNGTAGQYGWDLTGANAMVYYSQYDKKYADSLFGPAGSPIWKCACGPTSVSMIASTLNHDGSINPINVSAYYYAHGGVEQDDGKNCGSTWNWKVLADHYNLKYTDLGTDFNKINSILAQGGLVLISVGVGHFTTTGHLMVVRKTTPDGKFYLADPIGPTITSAANTTAFTVDQLRDPSFGNMRHLWGFTK